MPLKMEVKYLAIDGAQSISGWKVHCKHCEMPLKI